MSAITPPAERPSGRTLVLFDVDGTLAVPAQKAPQEIVDMLARLRERYVVGIVRPRLERASASLPLRARRREA